MELPETYRLIVEQSSDAVIFADPEGTIRIWNPGAEAIFGFLAGDAVGENLNLIIPEDMRAAHWAAFTVAIEAGRTKHSRGALTTRSLTKDRKKIYVSLSFSIVRDRSGLVLGALATGRDVTSIYLSEKDLKKRFAELESELKRLRAEG
jgi:PAS domain S-box-containing protein